MEPRSLMESYRRSPKRGWGRGRENEPDFLTINKKKKISFMRQTVGARPIKSVGQRREKPKKLRIKKGPGERGNAD